MLDIIPPANNEAQNSSAGELATDLEKGLTLGEVQKRISKYGYNEVPERKETYGRKPISSESYLRDRRDL